MNSTLRAIEFLLCTSRRIRILTAIDQPRLNEAVGQAPRFSKV